MTQDDVLKVFRQQAQTLRNEDTEENDTILQLAQLLATSRGRLSKENYDALMHIGAVMYKAGLRKFRAQSEVATTMSQSLEQEKGK